MHDGHAIRCLKQGDISGLERLVSQYQVKAIRTAFLIMGDPDLAEDIVQEAFMNVYRGIHHFDESRPFEPWFLRSVVNLAIKTAQKQARQVRMGAGSDDASLEDVLAAQDPSPEEQIEFSEFQQQVGEALQQLSPRQRAAVVQRYFLEMSEKEMAGELGAAPGTVKWLLNAARKNLRTLLGSERNLV